MKTIVITGSTRGIGYAMARAFLDRGCRVLVNGRSQKSTQTAVEALTKNFPSDRLLGVPGDVSELDQVQHLWDLGIKAFGQIDIWINNAGISHQQAPPWEIPADDLQAVIRTNILGELFGTQVAVQGFLQQGYGAVYNVEGMGGDGKTHGLKGFSVYGMSKAGLHYFNHCLAEEVQGHNIITGALQPGMVLTDMITERYTNRPEDWEKDKKILSLIANPIEDVAAWMAEKILQNEKNGVYFKYSNNWRILKRMVLSVFQRKDQGKP